MRVDTITGRYLSILLVLLLPLAGSCDRTTESAPPVKIGYLPIYVDLPLFVAKQEGFFDRHKVKVELVRFAGSPEIGTALTNGGVTVGASIAFSVVLSNESRDPGKLKIFIVDSEDKTNYLSSLVALPKSKINSVKDLRGKTLGVFPGPTALTFCKMILEKHGLNPASDVKLVELQAGSHVPALQSGTVDALFTYEPIATQAVMEIGAKKFLPGAVENEIMSPWQAGVWVVSSDFAQKNPEQARAVIAALYDAIEFIKRDPDAAKGSLTEFTSIRPAVAERTPTIPFAPSASADLITLQRHADILTAKGIVSKRLDVRGLIAPLEWTQRQQ